MSQEILNIILSAVSLLVTGLVGWGVSVFTSWLNTKIADKKMAAHLTQITHIITDAVMNIYQSFVETLKRNGKFDSNAQAEAKKAALEIINSQLTPELRDYIANNFGDVQAWLSNKIESVIYGLKATNKIAVNTTSVK